MCGYQGWFNCDGDGADLGWTHWAHHRDTVVRHFRWTQEYGSDGNVVRLSAACQLLQLGGQGGGVDVFHTEAFSSRSQSADDFDIRAAEP